MPPKLKLVYFNIRGRGELIRLVLYAGGVNFTDERVKYEEWPFRRAQAPNRQVPYIDVEGRVFGELLPIVRFIGRKCTLMGKGDDEQFQVEIILEKCHTFRDKLARPTVDSILSNGQRRFLEQKLQEDHIPKFLSLVEETLLNNKSGFVIGSDLTVADLSVWDTIDQLLDKLPDILKTYPKLLEHREKIRNIPKLRKYLETRPVDEEIPKNPKNGIKPPTHRNDSQAPV